MPAIAAGHAVQIARSNAPTPRHGTRSEEPRRQIPAQEANHAKRHAGQTRGDQGGDAEPPAPAHRRIEQMAERRHGGLRLLPRRPDKYAESLGVPVSSDPDVDDVAHAAQLAALYAVGKDEPDHRRLDTARCHPPPLAESTLRCQTSKAGAECVSSARSDLCGARGVTRVLTATDFTMPMSSTASPRVGGIAHPW
jgi:hypothetical protein